MAGRLTSVSVGDQVFAGRNLFINSTQGEWNNTFISRDVTQTRDVFRQRDDYANFQGSFRSDTLSYGEYAGRSIFGNATQIDPPANGPVPLNP
ncbi:MAG: hypothetical protein SFZ03_01820 [Candidatus Melainabacteria bacterium]|nr:hypothetical protein [Candidatus Melainabacteria bacterium]